MSEIGDPLLAERDERDERDERFWSAYGEGTLLLPVCDSCGAARAPEIERCPACLESTATLTPASGAGRLWSWVVMHRKILRDFPLEAPYPVALVELDEGPLLACAVEGDVHDLTIDQPMRVAPRDGDAAVRILRFAPADETSTKEP